MEDEKANMTKIDPELEAYRKILASKKSEIPFLNDIRKEIIINYNSEHVVELMEKYIK